MKKTNCKYYEPIVDGYRFQTSENSYRDEYELVDEVCNCEEKGGPFHHDEYDCENCPYYKKLDWSE